MIFVVQMLQNDLHTNIINMNNFWGFKQNMEHKILRHILYFLKFLQI